MTTTTRTRKAPYVAGDKVKGLMQLDDGATVLATIAIDRVTPLSDGRSWRIEGDRPASPRHPRVGWVVGPNGRDVNDYVAPAS